MTEGGAYGRRMAQHFYLNEAPGFTRQAHQGAFLAVTRLRCDDPPGLQTPPIPCESSYVVEWQLGASAAHELRANGYERRTSAGLRKGIRIVDLEHEHSAYLDAPFDCLHFYVPRSALDELAREHGAPRIDRLSCPQAETDQTANCLGQILLESMGPWGDTCGLFRDYVLLALHAHIAKKYGAMREPQRLMRGGLAPWQVRRATELLMANLEGNISMASLAMQCKLSTSHFARAFKSSVGKAPHRWLIEQRVGKAKALLNARDLPLADIALQCGFPERATFSRTFKREVGTSPGMWRRHGRS